MTETKIPDFFYLIFKRAVTFANNFFFLKYFSHFLCTNGVKVFAEFTGSRFTTNEPLFLSSKIVSLVIVQKSLSNHSNVYFVCFSSSEHNYRDKLNTVAYEFPSQSIGLFAILCALKVVSIFFFLNLLRRDYGQFEK